MGVNVLWQDIHVVYCVECIPSIPQVLIAKGYRLGCLSILWVVCGADVVRVGEALVEDVMSDIKVRIAIAMVSLCFGGIEF